MLYQPYVYTILQIFQYPSPIQYSFQVLPLSSSSFQVTTLILLEQCSQLDLLLLSCQFANIISHPYPPYHHLSTLLTLPLPSLQHLHPQWVQANTRKQVVEHHPTLESVEISHTLFLLFLSVTLPSPAQTRRAASPAPIAQHTLPVVQLSISPPSSYSHTEQFHNGPIIEI